MKKFLYWNLFLIFILTGICVFIFVLAVKNPQMLEIEGFKILFDVTKVSLFITFAVSFIGIYRYYKEKG